MKCFSKICAIFIATLLSIFFVSSQALKAATYNYEIEFYYAAYDSGVSTATAVYVNNQLNLVFGQDCYGVNVSTRVNPNPKEVEPIPTLVTAVDSVVLYDNDDVPCLTISPWPPWPPDPEPKKKFPPDSYKPSGHHNKMPTGGPFVRPKTSISITVNDGLSATSDTAINMMLFAVNSQTPIVLSENTTGINVSTLPAGNYRLVLYDNLGYCTFSIVKL